VSASPSAAQRREQRLFEKLAALGDRASRRQFLSRHPGLVRAEVVARLSEIVPRKVRVDVKEALALAEAAELIARRLRSPEALAQGLRAKGNALYGLNDHRAAVEHHEEAVRLFTRAGRTHEVARTLSTSILPLNLMGEYQRAHEAAARAREIFTREGDDLRLARLEINVGNIYHRQDRFAEGLGAYEQSYQRLLPHRNVEGLAVALGNMAVCLISLNDFSRALETHQRARAFCEQHGMPRLVGLADYNIAYLYYFRGQYGRAIEALKATREACQATGDAYLTSLCRLDLAEIYLDLNLSQEAMEMAQEARAGFRRLGNGYEMAKAISFLAIAHGQQGNPRRALRLCKEARALFVREENSTWPALLELYQALILFGAGRLDEARRHCLSALSSFAAPAVTKAILCRLLLARIALRTGDLRAARKACITATRDLAALDLPALRFQLHFVEGQIEQAAARLDEAHVAYRRAQGYLETLRSSLRGEELKIAFMKNKLEVYEGLVELSLQRGAGRAAAEEAFSYVEQAKSRSLQELLLRDPTPVPPGAAAKGELLGRVDDLREELNWYYHRIETEQMAVEERTAERLQGLREQMKGRENELLRVLRELPPADSEALELLSPVSLPLPAIRETLGDGAAIVEYFRAGDRLLAFVVTGRTLEVVPVAPLSTVQRLLRLLRFQLSWAHGQDGGSGAMPTAASLAAVRVHLEELYTELLAPVRPRLGDARHLVFVPHDLLHYVPFHALHDGERYLIDAYSVSYAPSATVFALCHRRGGGEGSLVLGVPEPHTPFVEDEARAVAASLGSSAELHLGAAATSAVLRDRGEGKRFVHIAAHGFFRPDNPMFSGIRLGAGSYLTLYDLYNLKLPADLVALSACVSGVSAIAAGDELLGLARGLFRAGAASLLLTLWEVPDQSTAEFMKAFYRRLPGGRPADSLREAMIEVRDRYPHPVHWAPFVLTGKS
jgi:tetratricopeptide (TPR) repeat protein